MNSSPFHPESSPDHSTSSLPQSLTPEQLSKDLRESMAIHLRQRAQEIIHKYGPINYSVLQQVLQDKKYTRYPVRILFDSGRIETGLFAITEAILTKPDQSLNQTENKEEDDDSYYIKPPDQSYEIVIHEYFKDQPEKLLPLILYQLPIVNYGNVVTYEDSEVFGASMMEISQEDYYQLVCDLVDSIP
jgi:hypothetical protein